MKFDPDNIATIIGSISLAFAVLVGAPMVLSYWTSYAKCQGLQTKYAAKGELLSCDEAEARAKKDADTATNSNPLQTD